MTADNPYDILAEHALAEHRAGRTIPLDSVRREVETNVNADLTFGALDAVRLERVLQDAKSGKQRHSWPEWMTILTEEVGEAARAANKAHWTDPTFQGVIARETDALREELVQIAAVAVAIIEHIDELEATHE